MRGFVVGASNILFKQKRNALDVITEVTMLIIEYALLDLLYFYHSEK